MKRIRVFCNAGMSTSMLVKKMVEVAQEQGIEVDIAAYPLIMLKDKVGEADIVLLGPQVGYELKKAKVVCDPLGIPVAVIPMADYGMMKGDNVLEFALSLEEN